MLAMPKKGDRCAKKCPESKRQVKSPESPCAYGFRSGVVTMGDGVGMLGALSALLQRPVHLQAAFLWIERHGGY